MAWLVTIALPVSADAEDLGRRLWALGTTGVAEVDLDGTTALIAGFDDHGVAERAASAIGPTAKVTPVDPAAWPVPEPQELLVGGRLLTIEVGHAFGHGHHPTTRLALEAVTRLATPLTSVLDIGTGTGILALAASALGSYPVVGIDIDPEAVAVAQRNAANNRLEATIIDVPLDQLSLRFDLVVVNMLANEVAPLATDIADRLRPGGSLIVTGLLLEQRDWVESMFTSLELTERSEGDDGWVRLIFTAASFDG